MGVTESSILTALQELMEEDEGVSEDEYEKGVTARELALAVDKSSSYIQRKLSIAVYKGLVEVAEAYRINLRGVKYLTIVYRPKSPAQGSNL